MSFIKIPSNRQILQIAGIGGSNHDARIRLIAIVPIAQIEIDRFSNSVSGRPWSAPIREIQAPKLCSVV